MQRSRSNRKIEPMPSPRLTTYTFGFVKTGAAACGALLAEAPVGTSPPPTSSQSGAGLRQSPPLAAWVICVWFQAPLPCGQSFCLLAHPGFEFHCAQHWFLVRLFMSTSGFRARLFGGNAAVPGARSAPPPGWVLPCMGPTVHKTANAVSHASRRASPNGQPSEWSCLACTRVWWSRSTLHLVRVCGGV